MGQTFNENEILLKNKKKPKGAAKTIRKPSKRERNKNANKRGRKKKISVVDSDLKYEIFDSSSSSVQTLFLENGNENQYQKSLNTVEYSEIEDEVGCIKSLSENNDHSHSINNHLEMQDISIAGSMVVNIHENETKTSVHYLHNKNSNEINNFTFNGQWNLLDLVFPDSELDLSIDEDELGDCDNYGCNMTEVQDYEENESVPIELQMKSDCMFTDTDKYKFKSCFKNIQSQIENFDRYRGAETPGGEASLYDVSEATSIDTRKLYRKTFNDLKLNMWYKYVYHSAQLARVGGNSFSSDVSTSSNPLSLDAQLDDILLKLTRGGGSSSYLPGENIWRYNYLKGIPSVDEVLNDSSTQISTTQTTKLNKKKNKKLKKSRRF